MNAMLLALAEMQRSTAGNTGLILNLAINYSSRSEMERAVRRIAGAGFKPCGIAAIAFDGCFAATVGDEIDATRGQFLLPGIDQDQAAIIDQQVH